MGLVDSIVDLKNKIFSEPDSYLKSSHQVRNIEWATTYHWDIRFHNGPAPFNDWFPAIDVEEPLASIESYQFPAYLSSYKIPKNTTSLELKVTFYDEIFHPIKEWLTNWINGEIFQENANIVNSNSFGAPSSVGYLEDIVKLIHVSKIGKDKNIIKTNSYWVYPEGLLNFNGTSSSEISTTQQTFVVAGAVIGDKVKVPK